MGTRVLVVDDEPTFCELIQAILHSAGIEADCLTVSEQALALFEREKFDAVFLDIQMPLPDGIELAKRLRSSALNRQTPIVMITGHRDLGALTRAFSAGANFFLFKPVDQQRLLRVVRASETLIQREKRRFQRVAVSREVSIENGGEKHPGKTLDLSVGGAFVRVTHALPKGSRVEVTLQLTLGRPPLRVKGQVVRVIGNDCMGIEFQALGTKESERLQEFLLPLILRETSAASPARSGSP